jgi:hypothetical protein
MGWVNRTTTVDTSTQSVSYDAYVAACAPYSGSYTLVASPSLFGIFTTALGIVGGVASALRIAIPLLVDMCASQSCASRLDAWFNAQGYQAPACKDGVHTVERGSVTALTSTQPVRTVNERESLEERFDRLQCQMRHIQDELVLLGKEMVDARASSVHVHETQTLQFHESSPPSLTNSPEAIANTDTDDDFEV